MTRSASTTGKTQRTYEMSEMSRGLLDHICIVLPNYTKTDLINLSIYWLGASFRDIQAANECDIKEAAKIMKDKLTETGYAPIVQSMVKDLKITNLDRFIEEQESRNRPETFYPGGSPLPFYPDRSIQPFYGDLHGIPLLGVDGRGEVRDRDDQGPSAPADPLRCGYLGGTRSADAPYLLTTSIMPLIFGIVGASPL